MIRRLVLFAFMLTAFPAAAEVVRVETRHRSEGQAWLFGAQADGACWLAVPLHVVETYQGGPAAPFVFYDAAGRSGESGSPIPVGAVPGAAKAAGSVTDLAFAPVIAGRTSCPSRLGLAPLAYVNALRTATAMRLSILQDTSIRFMSVNILRGQVDEVQGGKLLYEAVDAADRALLNAGISGSTVEIADSRRRMHPFAMTLEVRSDKLFTALRFDRIRAAFEQVIASEAVGQDTLPQQDGFSIAGIRGDPASDSQSLAEIAKGMNGCWRASVARGARTIDVTLAISSLGRVSEIRLISDRACGTVTTASVETIAADGSSSIVTTNCTVVPDGETPGCRVGRSAPLMLRIRLRPVDGMATLSAIVLR